MAVDDKEKTKEIRKDFGVKNGVILVVANMIGSGIFMSPDKIGSLLGGESKPIVLSWLAGGVLSFLGAFSYVELGILFPENGGDGVYLSKAYHPVVGCIYYYLCIFITFPGAGAVLSTEAFKFLFYYWIKKKLVIENGWLISCSSLFLIFVMCCLNVFRPVWGKYLAWGSMACKVVALSSIILVGSICLMSGNVEPRNGSVSSHKEDVSPFFVYPSVLLCSSWGYLGWSSMNFVAGRVARPERTFPRVIIIAVPLVVAVYFILNLIYLNAIPKSLLEDKKSKFVSVNLFELLLPDFLSQIIFPFLISLSLLGSVLGCFLAGSFVIQGASNNGLFPAFIGENNNRGSPHWSILFMGINSSIFLFIQKCLDKKLLVFISLAILVFNSFTAFGVVVLRLRKPSLKRPFRVWILVPILFALIGFFISTVGFLSFLLCKEGGNPFTK